MRRSILLSLSIMLVLGCNADSGETPASQAVAAGAESSANSRGGSLEVGGDRWTLVPSTQCSIYPNNQVNIAGHAAGDPSVEIVIDYGGPTGVTIGTYGREPWWQAIRETMQVEMEGRRKFRGTATFEVFRNGTRETAEGSFDITCA